PYSLWSQPLHHCFLITPLAPPELYTLSLHDALPIWVRKERPIPSIKSPSSKLVLPLPLSPMIKLTPEPGEKSNGARFLNPVKATDRKSTRLNSSHVSISYAVFCLKKKKNNTSAIYTT